MRTIPYAPYDSVISFQKQPSQDPRELSRTQNLLNHSLAREQLHRTSFPRRKTPGAHLCP